MATTIKLPPKLKARVAAAAKGTGQSPHAFMVEAIERQTEQAERRKRLVKDALEAEREALDTGLGFDAGEVHAYLEARVRRRKVARPRARPWRG